MTSRLVRFDNVATHGIVRDTPPIELPAAQDGLAWTDGQNIRFHDGKAEKFLGEVVLFSTSATCLWAEWCGLGPDANDRVLWAFLQDNIPNPLNLINVATAGAATNPIPLPATTAWTAAGRFEMQGCHFPPYMVINAWRRSGLGVNPVQFVVTVTPTASFQSMVYDASAGTTWGGLGYTAKVIRPLGRFLVALAYDDGTYTPDGVWWSTDAAANAMPGTWNPADTTENAGQTELPGSGEMIDLVPLREDGIIYKQYGAWRMRFVGGANVFDFEQIFERHGMFARDCGVALEDRHIVLGTDDVYMHNGVRATSIADRRTRRYIMDRMRRGITAAKLIHNQERGEVWFAIDQQDEDNHRNFVPNIVHVYDYLNDTWGTRDIPVSTAQNFAGGPLPKRVSLTVYGFTVTNTSETYGFARRIARTSDVGIHITDTEFSMNGTVMTSYVQRTGLDFDNPGQVKLLRKVWPRMTATSGSVEIRVGTQKHPEDTVTWSDYRTFTPGTDDAVTFDAKGRYHAIEFRSSANMNWTLSGFEVEIRDGGRY